MGLFSRRQQPENSSLPAPPAPPAALDLNKALDVFAVKAVEKQTEFAAMMHQQTLELVQLNAEITRNLVRTGGKRLGGKVRAKTAKRDARGRMRPDCRLCENAAITDPSADEIRAHMSHGIAAPPPPPPPARERIPVEILTTSDGDEVVECESCGASHEHGQHIN